MKYVADHDLHIHSHLSLCSNDPEQTVESILAYGESNGFSTLCITDHYWDSSVPMYDPDFGFYKPQNFEHIAENLPLPQGKRTRFLFGCETDLDYALTLGIPESRFDDFDLIIIPTTHMHMNGFTVRGDEGVAERAELWKKRLRTVLEMKLPFEKVGIAHLTCPLTYNDGKDGALRVFDAISDSEYRELFKLAADRRVGIELNFNALDHDSAWLEHVLRPYRIAKAEGCLFYFGSDAHHPKELERKKENFEKLIDLLDLDERDKFLPRR